FRVIRKRSAQDHDGNLTVELCIEGAPDFAHPTCAQWVEDFIWAKSLVRRRCNFGASAIQFSTTVNGVTLVSAALVTNRNRCPSRGSGKLAPGFAPMSLSEKSSFGGLLFGSAPSVTSTAISLLSNEK